MTTREADAQGRVALNIKVMARLRGVSLPELAKVSGLGSKQKLYDRLNGRTDFSVTDVFAIADALDISAGRLLSDPASLFDVGTQQSEWLNTFPGDRRVAQAFPGIGWDGTERRNASHTQPIDLRHTVELVDASRRVA